MCTNEQFWYKFKSVGGVNYNFYEGERVNAPSIPLQVNTIEDMEMEFDTYDFTYIFYGGPYGSIDADTTTGICHIFV